MHTFTILDAEWWTDEGAFERHWNSLADQEPVLTQIGAIKVGAEKGFPIVAEFNVYIIPRDETGKRLPLTPYARDLTGITEELLNEQGIETAQAMQELQAFKGTDTLYSWGHDYRTFLITLFVQGLTNPFTKKDFCDIRPIFEAAGVEAADLERLNSGKIAEFLGARLKGHREHDGLHDCRSILAGLRVLEAHRRELYRHFVKTR